MPLFFVYPSVTQLLSRTRLARQQMGQSGREPLAPAQGTDPTVHSAEDPARIVASLKNRPSTTLRFMKPV